MSEQSYFIGTKNVSSGSRVPYIEMFTRSTFDGDLSGLEFEKYDGVADISWYYSPEYRQLLKLKSWKK